MFNRLKILLLIVCLIVTGAFAQAAQAPLKIVTTQTLFADLARQIGGDKVEVKSVASPKFNIHFIQPRPSDVRNLAKADLYIFTGLDIEAWSDPLVEAAGKPQFFRGGSRSLDLSTGVRLLKMPDGPLSRSMGDMHLFGNPHYPMNPENARIMAASILEKLKEIDPDNAAFYEQNAQSFLSRLDQKIAEWKSLCSHCVGQEIVSYHDDIAYFADFLGLRAEQFIEPKPGIPPTPKHLQFLEAYVREKGVKAIVQPTYFARAAAESLAKKSGAKVILICQNAGELSGTEDVFSFFDYNVKLISEALR